MNLFDGSPVEKFRDDERERVFGIADMILQLCEVARREGLLALYDKADFDSHRILFDEGGEGFGPKVLEVPLTDEEHLVFSTLLHLVTEGCAREEVAEIAKYAVGSSPSDGTKKLALMLGAEGILDVCDGTRRETVMIRMAMMMGANAADYYSHRKALDDERPADNDEIRAFFARRPSGDEDGGGDSGSEPDFDSLASLGEGEILSLMHEVRFDDVVLALKYTSAELREKILGSCPKKIAARIREEGDVTGPVPLAEIRKSQAAILKAAERLFAAE